MNPKTAYNNIIDFIEEEVCCDFPDKPSQIADKAAAELGMQTRSLGSIFQFISGITLISYIRSRLMNNVYTIIINSDSYDYRSISHLQPYENQASFITEFKRLYNMMTPAQACKEKNYELITKPRHWDDAIEGKSSPVESEEESRMPLSNRKYGVFSKEKAELFLSILNLQAMYGLDEDQTEKAVSIWRTINQKHKAEMEKAFDYVSKVGNNPFLLEEESENLLQLAFIVYGIPLDCAVCGVNRLDGADLKEEHVMELIAFLGYLPQISYKGCNISAQLAHAESSEFDLNLIAMMSVYLLDDYDPEGALNFAIDFEDSEIDVEMINQYSSREWYDERALEEVLDSIDYDLLVQDAMGGGMSNLRRDLYLNDESWEAALQLDGFEDY